MFTVRLSVRTALTAKLTANSRRWVCVLKPAQGHIDHTNSQVVSAFGMTAFLGSLYLGDVFGRTRLPSWCDAKAGASGSGRPGRPRAAR